MRFAVVGAGAIGAYVGAALSRGGSDVTVVARGAHLEAMQRDGIAVKSPRGDFRVRTRAVAQIGDVGEVDVVILALKAHQIGPVAAEIGALLRPGTTLVSMQNGIPWWYFYRHGGPLDGTALQSVDPDGRIATSIDSAAVLGCVIYCSTEIEAPGVIRHLEGTRYSLGEPDRSRSPRALAIAQEFVAGGLKAPVEPEIRRDIWVKLLGNASFNPISALTRSTLVDMCNDPAIESLVESMMRESVAIGERLGIAFDVSVERRIDGARRVGAHKTSMLQDLEARKPLELDALLGVVVELGRLTTTPTPASTIVYGLAKRLEAAALAGR